MPVSAPAERKSAQRSLVVRIVESRCDHPTAQEVFHQARRLMPSISLGTVYRNLQRMVEQGVLHESRNGRKPARYEARRQRHYHIHCTVCGSLEDVAVPYQRSLDRQVERLLRYRLEEHRTEFYGICPRCQGPRGRRNSRQVAARRGFSGRTGAPAVQPRI